MAFTVCLNFFVGYGNKCLKFHFIVNIKGSQVRFPKLRCSSVAIVFILKWQTVHILMKCCSTILGVSIIQMVKIKGLLCQ